MLLVSSVFFFCYYFNSNFDHVDEILYCFSFVLQATLSLSFVDDGVFLCVFALIRLGGACNTQFINRKIVADLHL